MAMRFQRKAAGRCKGVCQLQEEERFWAAECSGAVCGCRDGWRGKSGRENGYGP